MRAAATPTSTQPPPLPAVKRPYRRGQTVLILAGVLGGIVIVGIAALNLAGRFGYLPGSRVLLSPNIKSWHSNTVDQTFRLATDETLFWFYSSGFLHFDEQFQFMSNKRLGVLSRNADGTVVVQEMTRTDIARVENLNETAFWEDSQIRVHSREGSSISVTLGREDGAAQLVAMAMLRGMPPFNSGKPIKMKGIYGSRSPKPPPDTEDFRNEVDIQITVPGQEGQP